MIGSRIPALHPEGAQDHSFAEEGWRGARGSLAQPVGVSDLFRLSSQLISNRSYPSSLALAGDCQVAPPSSFPFAQIEQPASVISFEIRPKSN